MEAHQVRVINERLELKTKINALDKFIGAPINHETFIALPVEEQVLLKLQLRYMLIYLSVLQERITRWEEGH